MQKPQELTTEEKIKLADALLAAGIPINTLRSIAGNPNIAQEVANRITPRRIQVYKPQTRSPEQLRQMAEMLSPELREQFLSRFQVRDSEQ